MKNENKVKKEILHHYIMRYGAYEFLREVINCERQNKLCFSNLILKKSGLNSTLRNKVLADFISLKIITLNECKENRRIKVIKSTELGRKVYINLDNIYNIIK